MANFAFPQTVGEILTELRDRLDALPLPLTMEHAIRLAGLPLHHRDPFDRLLVAQASFEGLTLLSQDPQMLKYGIPVVS